MRVVCEYCLKNTKKTPRTVRIYKHHFCGRECYRKYKQLNKEEFMHRNNTGPKIRTMLVRYAKAKKDLQASNGVSKLI